MREDSIDGIFMQCFVITLKSENRKAINAVLEYVMKTADENDRAVCITYDLSEMKPEDTNIVIKDWKNLVGEFQLTFRQDNCGGCFILPGLPSRRRDLTRDAIRDNNLHEVIHKYEIVLPWPIDCYTDENSYEKFSSIVADDLIWCKKNHLDYALVVLPGFSWHNLKEESAQEDVPNSIHRMEDFFPRSRLTIS